MHHRIIIEEKKERINLNKREQGRHYSLKEWIQNSEFISLSNRRFSLKNWNNEFCCCVQIKRKYQKKKKKKT